MSEWCSVGADDLEFRRALGHYPTGTAVIGAMGADGEPIGMLVGSFVSVSMDPPLVAYLPQKSSGTYARLSACDSFSVSVLSHEQQATCLAVAKGGPDRFAGIDWTTTPSGAPVIEGSVVALECTVSQTVELGDHYMVVGEVESMRIVDPVPPLLFFQGGFGTFLPLGLAGQRDATFLDATERVGSLRPRMQEAAERYGTEVFAYAKSGADMVLVASTTPEGVCRRTPLGSRFPIAPPLGEVFVAWDPDARQVWLDNAERMLGAESRMVLEHRLTRVRSQGWSGSPTLGDGWDLMAELKHYSRSTATPALLKEMEASRARAARAYLGADMKNLPAVSGVASVTVPVRDSGGRVVMSVGMGQLPDRDASERVLEFVSTLKVLAAELELPWSSPDAHGVVGGQHEPAAQAIARNA